MAIERDNPATPIAGTDEMPEQEELSISIDNPDSVANELGGDLISQYQADKDSRSEWEESYVKGLDQLGLKIEERTTPWAGACGVFHPMLSEAVIRFQSQSIAEMFPAQGPVRTKIVGKLTEDKTKQAGRVQDYLNYLLTHEMSEYRTETEKMLFSLPLAGSAFRKVYYDPNLERPASIFVPAEDVVVNYGASDLETCQRATHVMHKSSNEVRKMQVAGFYRDIDKPEPADNQSDIRKKYDEMTGESRTYNYDDRHTILEMQVDLDLEGYEDMAGGKQTGIALPYVVSIDYPSGQVLSIRRNYFQDDPKKLRRMHFVHYQYLPGLGFYGFGLIHMVGGLAKSATSILRQLVDAGTLSNLPGGLKARGLRIKGDDTPIMPGEFRDVDVPGGAIRENITFLPYKEPSGTLYQLLQNIVEEGRRFASMNDMKVSDMNNQAPVGTTLALLERNMKVMSAVQARLHASMRKEFEILVGIVRDFTQPAYPYEMDDDEFIKVEDFDNRVDVLPVSDPNASTMAQRIMQYQAAMQLATSAPQIYNMPELHRQMLETLGIRNVEDIIPDTDDIKPVDPVTAVQNLINGKPVKAFSFQDHEAHIETIVAAQQNADILEQLEESPNQNAILANASAYVNEHLTMMFRKQVEEEMGIPLPPEGEPIPPEVEKRISDLVAEAAQRVAITSQAKQQQARIQEQIAGVKIGQDIARDLLELEERSDSKKREDYKLGLDIAKDLVQSAKDNGD